MKIASWNINSLRKRQERLLDWLAKEEPDVVCLQETKCSDDQFPELALSAAGSPACQYKLQWFVQLRDCVAEAQKSFPQVIVCGDFNVAPEDRDVHDPALWRGAIMCSEEERAAFHALEQIGLRDTLRLHHAEGGLFSWWDYRMLAFQKNRGLRIDAILASKSLAERCAAARIDREMRKGKDPSDHAPVWAEFSDIGT